MSSADLAGRRFRLASPRTALAVLVGFTAALGVAVANVVAGHQVVLDSFDGLAVIDHAAGWFALVQMICALIGLPFIVWCAPRQFVAWRRSTGERRQQLTWLARPGGRQRPLVRHRGGARLDRGGGAAVPAVRDRQDRLEDARVHDRDRAAGGRS
jgi:hypothetical protein